MIAGLRAYLALVRLPNLFTAAADIVAGFLFVGGRFGDLPGLGSLIAASMCLYAGGVAFNDVCDADRDRHNRPSRPIPSGRISRRAAHRFAFALLTVGVLIALTVSRRAGLIAALIVLAIVLYDDVFKRTVFGPAFMGLCRALNLALGMSEAQELTAVVNMLPLALIWLYVASLTFFARAETGENRGLALWIATHGLCGAAAVLACVLKVVPSAHVGAPFLALGLACAVGFVGFRAARRPSPRVVQAAVGRFVMGLVLFDACLAWSAAGPTAALLVASLLLPTILLAHLFDMS